MNFRKMKHAHYRLWALRHRNRWAIIKHLQLVGCDNVTNLMIHFRIRQDEMSQRLAILRKAGYLQTERLGKEIYYSVDEESLSKVFQAVNKFNQNYKNVYNGLEKRT